MWIGIILYVKFHFEFDPVTKSSEFKKDPFIYWFDSGSREQNFHLKLHLHAIGTPKFIFSSTKLSPLNKLEVV